MALERGWREWVARWVGREDLAQAPVSVVAAAGRADQSASEATPWMATPLHLAAGLTTLHFDVRGILRLPPEELDELSLDFHRSFQDSTLVPLASGEFLLHLAGVPPARTTEPARIAGGNVADALPQGAGAASLRRLGAEIEMWLHEHSVNRARVRRGELPVSTLWIWGGGATFAPMASARGDTLPRALGSDSYLRGLWQLCGGEARSLPDELDPPYAESAVLVVEAGQMLRTKATWSMPELLGEVDRRFIAKAVSALERRDIQRVSILANDRCLVLGVGGSRKFWRRARPALEGLQ